MSEAVLLLPAAFRDVCAADLRLRLDLPPQDALAARTIAQGDWTLDLRILGASHQVLLAHRGARICSETVACGGHAGQDHSDPLDDPLPGRRTRDQAGVRYRFRSGIVRLAPEAFRSRVDELIAGLTSDPNAVCGVFPGEALSITGVQAALRSEDVVSWRTWHTYPRTGELVVTCTRVARRPIPTLHRAP